MAVRKRGDMAWPRSCRVAAAGACLAALTVRWARAGAAEKHAVLIVDANTGRTLYQSSADAPRHPGVAGQDDDALPRLRADRAGPPQLPDQDQDVRQRRGSGALQARS